jgi:hypothetical protein
MKTRLERDPQQTAQCVYSIPWECGRSYIGETGRPWQCGSVNIGIISNRVFWNNQNYPNMPTKKVIKLVGTKPGFWILKATASIGNTKKRPIWLAVSTRLANPVWTFFPSGSPVSAMRSTFHRENLYDVTDVHLILLGLE